MSGGFSGPQRSIQDGLAVEERFALIEFKHVNKVYPNGTKGLIDVNLTIEQGDIVIGTLGPTTAKAVRDAGLRLDIEAPSPQYPSISSAIDDHLRKVNG